MSSVAIVGAGVAGLAAARTLAAAGLAPVIFEKSRGVGGRAATRRLAGCSFDHGAQYLKAPSAALRDLVAAVGGAVDIGRPVWLCAADGSVAPGDPALNAEPKWTWPGGLTTLARHLAAGLDVRLETTVGRLSAADGGYALAAADGRELGGFAAVLLTAPAPQAAAILAAGDPPAPDLAALRAALDAARYRRSITVAAAFARRPAVPWYALVNPDRGHPVSWLACEHDKPGRTPAGQGLLLAQMADRWAIDHWDALARGTFSPDDALPAPVAAAVGFMRDLAGELGPPLWVNLQRWRYALPEAAVAPPAAGGIYLAGDMVAGQGRLHLAIESGWRAAEQILAALGA